MKHSVNVALNGALILCAMGMGAIGMNGCMTGQNQTTLDAITGGATQPYGEAFVEYRGPQEKWAGPSNWVMHVSAKEGEKPRVSVPAAWMSDTSETRRPASQLITGEEARAKIGELAVAMSEQSVDFQGCMYPVHVRLVRMDGKVVDRQGCRNQSHWSKAASEAVDFFLAAVR